MKASSSEGNNLQRTLKDGYESDSTLSYRRHQFVPQQSQNKSLYTQVTHGYHMARSRCYNDLYPGAERGRGAHPGAQDAGAGQER